MAEDATIFRIPYDAKAWREGYLAGRHGAQSDANPYSVGTREAQAWLFGLADGRSKRLWIVDNGRP